MDVVEAIKCRRSTRKYSTRVIPEKTIREILEAGRLAPSGCNAQPTRYILVSSKKAKESLRLNNIFAQDWVYETPLIIIYCGNPIEYTNQDGIKTQQKEGTLPANIRKISNYFGRPKERIIKDLSISSAFTVLRATELGLGTCYIGLINRGKINQALGIPREYVIPFSIAVGYPEEETQQSKRKPIEELILKRI